MGWTIDQVHELTKIDRWFLAEMKQLVDFEDELMQGASRALGNGLKAEEHRESLRKLLRRAKEWGYSDVQIGNVLNPKPLQDLKRTLHLDLRPVYKLVDTCAAEFEAATPYYYSSYEEPYVQLTKDNAPRTIVEDEIRLSPKPKVIIIGGGPNRIGQGIEFD